RQQRQRVPDLAFEVQRSVHQVMQERADRAVDMRLLPARMAMRTDQPGPAVEARPLLRVAIARTGTLAGRRLHRTRDQPALRQFADRLDIVHEPALGLILTGRGAPEKKRPRSLRGAASLVIGLRGLSPRSRRRPRSSVPAPPPKAAWLPPTGSASRSRPPRPLRRAGRAAATGPGSRGGPSA